MWKPVNAITAHNALDTQTVHPRVITKTKPIRTVTPSPLGRMTYPRLASLRRMGRSSDGTNPRPKRSILVQAQRAAQSNHRECVGNNGTPMWRTSSLNFGEFSNKLLGTDGEPSPRRGARACPGYHLQVAGADLLPTRRSRAFCDVPSRLTSLTAWAMCSEGACNSREARTSRTQTYSTISLNFPDTTPEEDRGRGKVLGRCVSK